MFTGRVIEDTLGCQLGYYWKSHTTKQWYVAVGGHRKNYPTMRDARHAYYSAIAK
jgi:hypothetical protein